MTKRDATQLADYECALETIGNVIALKARDIAHEQRKATPDEAHVDTLRREQSELAGQRSKLRLEDREGIASVIDQYGKLVRANALQGPL